MKTRRRDRGVKKGENQNQNPKDQAAAQNEQKGEGIGKKVLKTIGKGAMYVGIGALTVCGVWAVIGAIAGRKGNSNDSEDDENDEEEDSDDYSDDEDEAYEEALDETDSESDAEDDDLLPAHPVGEIARERDRQGEENVEAGGDETHRRVGRPEERLDMGQHRSEDGTVSLIQEISKP